jgi:hypothetical protein
MSRLKDLGVSMAPRMESKKILTERRTPMPTKMTFAGGNTLKDER